MQVMALQSFPEQTSQALILVVMLLFEVYLGRALYRKALHAESAEVRKWALIIAAFFALVIVGTILTLLNTMFRK